MPTTGSADAFTNLVGARERLRDLTIQLNKAKALFDLHKPESTVRYRVLREQWEAALREFKVASEKFSVTVRNLDEEKSGDVGSPD